ncbi:preprotein translocase subunit YajC [Bifidobacterium aquikefiricola]|uniref:Preprotein translocase subunit YajC n=1 Tax=Bifidobacterium aquikefiricola TaxID=3059038 RepID=A0AB39U947_9BIFI
MQYLFLIILVVAMAAMMWWQSRKAKQQQGKAKDFRESLQPGKEVSTYSGLLGTIVSVDLEKEQVVIDSEGSQSKWRIQAITEPPVVPAYVHDDEVDENGNPLPQVEDGTVAQPADGTIDTTAVDDAQIPVEAQADASIPDAAADAQSTEPTSKNN